MNTFIKKLSVIMLTIAIGILTFNMDAHATETDDDAYDIRDSIVQVVMVYCVDSENGGGSYVISSGTGVVVADNVVATQTLTTQVTDAMIPDLSTYINGVTGKTIEFKKESIVFGVSVYDKDLKQAKFVQCSAVNIGDVTLLIPGEDIKRPMVTMEYGSSLAVGNPVTCYGFPTPTDFMTAGVPLYRDSDLIIKAGQIAAYDEPIIVDDTVLEAGSAGGVMTDANGNFIGLLFYAEADAAQLRGQAISVEYIRTCLDKQGIVGYKNVKEDNEVVAPTTEETVTPTIDKTKLRDTIDSAKEYLSDESVMEAVEQAKSIMNSIDATQEQIDQSQKNLEDAINAAKDKANSSKTWIIIVIIVAVIVIAVVVVVLVLVLKNNGKKKKDEITILGGQPTPSSQLGMGGYQQGVSGAFPPNGANNYQPNMPNAQPMMNQQMPNQQMPNQAMMNQQMMNQQMPQQQQQQQMQPNFNYGQAQMQMSAAKETTVLNVAAAQMKGTTVLGTPQAKISGYIMRCKDSRKNCINSVEYIIGKDPARVSYLIQDNGSISRAHAKIVKKGMDYYIVDMDSTNYTYLNGTRVVPGEEKLLKNSDIIRLSDEEFVFTIE